MNDDTSKRVEEIKLRLDKLANNFPLLTIEEDAKFLLSELSRTQKMLDEAREALDGVSSYATALGSQGMNFLIHTRLGDKVDAVLKKIRGE